MARRTFNEIIATMSATELMELLRTDDDLYDVVSNHIISNNGSQEYIKAFNEHWGECFTLFREVTSALKHLSVCLWLTDCGEDETLFGKWYFENTECEVENTLLYADISVVNVTNSQIEAIVQSFFGRAYDNGGRSDAYWRLEAIDTENVSNVLHQLIKLDQIIGIVLNDDEDVGPWLDEQEMCEMCGNKSIREITDMFRRCYNEELVRQSIRYYMSRKLGFDHNTIQCNIVLDTREACALSTLQMPCVKLVEMDSLEGMIFVHIEGCEEPLDFDDFSTEDQFEIAKNIE